MSEEIPVKINREPSDIEKAYGLLWRSPAPDPLVQEARKHLLSMLDTDQRKKGVMWAIKVKGPPTPAETIAVEVAARIEQSK